MIVAEITKDHITVLTDPDDESQVGRQFDSEALRQWWGWGLKEGIPADTYFKLAESNSGKIDFKLYDDDNELYYEGWLIDDDEAIVQQFVLRWAEADSGCTLIEVKRPLIGFTQEIG